MKNTEYPEFLSALETVAAVFSDPLNAPRIKTYWLIMRELMTLAEFEDACKTVLTQETFNKIPLPAVFIDVVHTHRRRRRDEESAMAARQIRETRALSHADWSWARLHLEMINQGIGRPGHYDVAADTCEHYATVDLDNAPDWRAEAAWWRAGAHGRCELPSMTARASGKGSD